MRKWKILAVVPYEGLKDMLNNIAKERPDLEITAYHADLERGAELVSQLDECEYDVILSRGGTAKLIREIATLPVIEIALSHYDILNAMRLAENHTGKYAIVGFPNICKMAKVLSNILQYDIDIVVIEQPSDVSGAVRDLIKQGYTMILGDVTSCAEAQRQELNSMLITSSRDPVLTAIDDAVQFCQHTEKVREQNQLLNVASRLGDGGILVYLEEQLLYSNIQKNKDLYLDAARKMHPFVFKDKRYVLVQKFGKQNMKFTGHFKQLDGKSYYFYVAEQVSRSEHSIIPGVYTILKEDVPSRFFSLDYNYDAKRALYQDIERYCKSTLPVLIVGESGTGKERVAKMIYQGGTFSKNPCYCIDFNEIDSKGFSYLLESSNSCLLKNENTIYLKNIDALSEEKLQRLFNFIENSHLQGRNRLLISMTTNLSDLHQQSAYRIFNSRMPCLTLKLTPLRKRAEDIPGLLGTFLNEINAVQGANILGCEPQGVAMLKQFSWEDNLGQFKRVLSTLAATCDGPYISAESVQRVLEKESRNQPPPASGELSVNINQSLEKISQEIATAVLREENMNHTKAAKRLGISRTTLWRMMRLDQ